MRPYSLCHLRNYMWMTKSQLRVKQICPISLISNATNKKNDLRLTSFQKTTTAICFNLPQVFVHVIINVTLNEIWAARNLATFENSQQPASATIRKVKHRLRQWIRAAYNFNNIPVFKKTWGHKQVLCKIENQTLQVLI